MVFSDLTQKAALLKSCCRGEVCEGVLYIHIVENSMSIIFKFVQLIWYLTLKVHQIEFNKNND